MGRERKYKLFVLSLLCVGAVVLAVYTRKSIAERLPKGTKTDTAAYSVKASEGSLSVYPCGFPIGVYLETDGVMVIGTSILEGDDGINYEPALSKIKAGDYIVKLNGIDVSSKSQLGFLVNKYGNEDIILTVKRNKELIEVKLTPIKVSDTEYKLGLWVRDDSQGIGTMTFVTNRNTFGALGHGISDVDTKELLDAAGGTLYGANIWGIKKGKQGVPGGLYGVISYEDENVMGLIESNTSEGIYGSIDYTKLLSLQSLEPAEICSKEDIKEGSATIITTVSDKRMEYEIQIKEIDIDCDTNKCMVIQITDDELLRLTGGIVQGMSGSPILQNGKIVGAVTHVFVDDPTKGYGIFIENMLEH